MYLRDIIGNVIEPIEFTSRNTCYSLTTKYIDYILIFRGWVERKRWNIRANHLDPMVCSTIKIGLWSPSYFIDPYFITHSIVDYSPMNQVILPNNTIFNDDIRNTHITKSITIYRTIHTLLMEITVPLLFELNINWSPPVHLKWNSTQPLQNTI